METVNERSTAYVSCTFKDKNGDAQAPVSASYTLDCITTGTEIRADTALTPAETIEIVLTADDNAMVSELNVEEVKRVTVKAVHGTGDEVTGEIKYRVKNMYGV